MTTERWPATLADATNLVEEIEARFPVEEWTSNGVRIWPFVRARLGRRLFERMRLGRTSSRQLSAAGRAIRERGRLGRDLVRGTAHPLDAGQALGAVFLSDGVSWASTGDLTFDRWCEPYQRGLESVGHSTLLLVPRSPSGGRVRMPHIDLAGATVRRLLLARAKARQVPVQLRDHGAVDRVVSRLGGPGLLLDYDAIRLAGAALDLLARRHAATLERGAPRVGLAVEYYSLQGMSFMLACHRAGITCVDLQHGVQGKHHPAYGSWSQVPDGGYELLPDVFLVWGAEDADAIDVTPRNRHRAIVGGNPAPMMWSEGAHGDVGWTRETLAAVVDGAARSVLVPLGGDEAIDELRWLVDLIGVAPATWRWWIRCHPTRDERYVLSNLLAARGVANASVDLATSAPLHALLEVVDVTLSRFSTVVRDAADVGVPSVIVDPLGVELFGHWRDAGVVEFVESGDVAAVIVALEGARRVANMSGATQVLPGVAWLRELAGVHGS